MTDIYAEARGMPPRPDASAAGRNSHNKGRAWERAVASRMTAAGIPAKRGLMQARGAAVPDVVAPGMWCELKCGKRPNPRAALRQAARDNAAAGGGRLEVVIIHDDQVKPGQGAHEWVCMPLEDWLEMAAQWYAARSG